MSLDRPFLRLQEGRHGGLSPGRCCQTRPRLRGGSTYNTTRGDQDEANSAKRVRIFVAWQSTTILQSVDMTGVTSVIKFKFTAGTISTGQLFTMGFCFQDPSNTTAAPCGSSGEYVVVVPGGGSALAVIPASLLTGHILVVVNPTSTPVRYTVVME